MGLGQAQVLC